MGLNAPMAADLVRQNASTLAAAKPAATGTAAVFSAEPPKIPQTTSSASGANGIHATSDHASSRQGARRSSRGATKAPTTRS